MRDSASGAVWAVTLSLLVGLSQAADSPAAVTRAPTNLPPQSLGSALHSLAMQRKFQIVFASKEVSSLRTQGVVGDYTVEEALQKILSGTGLTYVYLADGTVAITWSDKAATGAVKRSDESSGDAQAPLQQSGAEFSEALDAKPSDIDAKSDRKDGAARRGNPLSWFATLLGVCAVSGPGAVCAQDASTVNSTAAGELEEVVVTGSRVITNGNNSPTPLTVVNTDQLLAVQPGPVAEALASLPAFAGSRTSVGNPGSGVSNAGANHLNLRYLGYLRTLVLFDGKRVPPTTFDQIVDIDVIPQLLLQRVDMAIGGVSAVYGSDAVAGVVNFVPDANFNGLKAELEYGISDRGDNKTITAGVAAGRPVLDGRGHFEFSYGFRDDPGIARRSEREWGRQVWTVQGAGTAAAPYRLVQNTRISTSTFGGLISNATGTGAALNGQSFETNGVLSSFVNGAPTGAAGFQSGGSGAYYDSSLKASLQSHQVFTRFDYDLGDALHTYVQGSYTKNETESFEQYNRLTNITFSGTNPFLAPSYEFNGTFRINKFMSQMPRINTRSEQEQYFVIAGLDGKLADTFNWEVAASQSRASSITQNDAQINNQRLYAALDAVRDTSGNIVCRVTTTHASLYPGCVPLNAFGPSAASPDSLAYITQPTGFKPVNEMTDVSGSIAGSLFDSWAGPVQMALSGEWRRQTLEVTSTGRPSDVVNCTGLQFNCTAGRPLWADPTLADLAEVKQSVAEAAFEVDVPLLTDLPFARDVSVNGAVRYTDYDTSGAEVTWKMGAVWSLTDSFKLRGTRSRDIRAPTLYDLFQPQAISISLLTDNLTNQQINVPVISGGNPGLSPEVGHTTTAGFVYQPEWLPQFSVSIDGYYIRVSNALVSQDGSNTTAQLLCYQSGGASNYCSLQSRPINFTDTSPANTATAFYSRQVNISEIRTYGADLEINYATDLLNNPLKLRGLVTWQPHLTQQTPGATMIEGAGMAFASTGAGGAFAVPRVRVSLFADYEVGNFRFALKERWRSALSLKGTPGAVYDTASVAATAYTDINIAYRPDQGWMNRSEIFLTVQNLFDKQPPPAAGSGQSARVGSFGGFALGDDPIGRYFTLGVRVRI